MVVNDSVTAANCTIVKNSAKFTTGGVRVEGDLSLANSILWDNTLETASTTTEAQMASYNKDPISVIRCDIEGGWGSAVWAISSTPQFYDEAAGDLRLRSISPCIDSGWSAGVPSGITTDLDGNPRIAGSAVDMGAYEFQP